MSDQVRLIDEVKRSCVGRVAVQNIDARVVLELGLEYASRSSVRPGVAL